MSSTVKYFHSGLAGAPVLSGTAGAMIGVLDACLVNGWGSGTVDSLTITSGVATVTRGAGHPFEADMVTEIAGATVSGGAINGQFKILNVTATTYTFAAAGIPNQTATGTITHKIAALGWQKVYSATNIAAYRSTDVTGTRLYLRVDDTGTTNTRIVGYESMTDANTGVGPFPTAAQQAGGRYWCKSIAASATARAWVLVGNAVVFYGAAAYGVTQTEYEHTVAFGDLAPARSGDAYACFANGGLADPVGYTAGSQNGQMGRTADEDAGSAGLTLARSWTGLGGGVSGGRNFTTLSDRNSSGGFASGAPVGGHVAFPNPGDGGLYVSPMTACEPGAYRGVYRGLYGIPQAVGGTVFAMRAKVVGVTGLPGRTLMMLPNVYSNGVHAIDITGPWA